MGIDSIIRKGRMTLIGCVVAIFFGIFLIPSVQSVVWLNLAQIYQMKDDNHNAQRFFIKALEQDPLNVHTRWSVGSALIRMNNFALASDILFPLVHLGSPNSVMVNSIFVALLADKRDQEVLRFYKTLPENDIPLSSNVAAQLILAYLRDVEQTQLSYEQEIHLLVQALAPKREAKISPLLQEQITLDGFWSTTLGKKLKETLIWRSHLAQQERKKETPIIPSTQTIGTMLDIPKDTISFGNELLVNGTFDQNYDINGIPKGWQPWFRVGNTSTKVNDGIFVVGVDNTLSFEGSSSLRIDALVVENHPDKEGTRAGVFQAIPSALETNQSYVLTFVYRSTVLGGDIYIPGVFYHNLPSTEGIWKRGTIVFLGKETKNPFLFLRLWREGDIWFDSFSMRELHFNEPVEIGDSIMQVEDVQ